MGNDIRFNLPEEKNRELVERLMAYYENGKTATIGQALALETEYGGFDLRLLHEAVGREIQHITDNQNGDPDRQEYKKRLLEKQQKLAEVIEGRKSRALNNKPADRTTNFKDSVSTPAMSPNQVRGRVPATTDESEDKWHAPIHHTFTDNVQRSNCHNNPTAVLFYLMLHKGYEGKKDERHQTGKYWYCQRKLIVASVGQEKISQDLGINVSNVKRYLKKLINNGDITRENEKRENVYVLGYVDKDGVEHYYHRGIPKDG